jgi:hypothetical protein
MRAHLESPPPPIGPARPEVPPGLAAVLGRMLAKDPADRFQSPAEVAEALRPFTAGADLSRLLTAAGAEAARAEVPSAEAPTPAPGLGDTAPDRGSPGRRFPPSFRRPALTTALAGLGLLLAAAAFLWPGFGGSPGPAAKPLEIKDMRVTHLRDRGETRLGDLRTSPTTVRLDDNVEVAAELTVPAYYYLIAFNPRGSEGDLVQLCLPEGKDGRDAETVRPDRRTEVQYPRKDNFILDAAGLQAFVLAASTKPLPPFKDWRSQAGPIPWEGVRDSGAWRWHFDGRDFTRFPRERGRVEPRDAVPEPLRKLCAFFKGRAEFEAVQAVAFPVADGRK